MFRGDVTSTPMTSRIPVIGHDDVLKAIPPRRAIERTREGFVRHFSGEWSMPSKVYLDSAPHGDFRAMPAMGEGLAILKWVTSFPGNRTIGRPVVYGTIFVNDAHTGEPLAVVDGRAVTALRTGAAAAVATAALARDDSRSAGLIGCGLHGRWSALCLKEAGFGEGICYDNSEDTAQRLAEELGWRAGTKEEALACDVVTLVTPGNEPVVQKGQLRAGAHVNAMGADGSGKAEVAIEEVLRCELFCDEWDQASHGGELAGAVEAGSVKREDVTDLGAVLTGGSPGRSNAEAITLFDSTGLAIQDLAMVLEVLTRHRAGEVAATEIEI